MAEAASAISPALHTDIELVAELEAAIGDDIEHHKANPSSFVWTKKAEDILAKVARARAALDN